MDKLQRCGERRRRRADRIDPLDPAGSIRSGRL